MESDAGLADSGAMDAATLDGGVDAGGSDADVADATVDASPEDGGSDAGACAALDCGAHGVCAEDTMTPICICDTEYTGERCELDLDECELPDTNDCAAHADCVNQAPGFSCVCPAPYEGDGRTCACPAGQRELSTGGCATERVLTLRFQNWGAVSVNGTLCEDSCIVSVAQGDTLTLRAELPTTMNVSDWDVAGCVGDTCELTIPAGDVTLDLAFGFEHNIAFVTSSTTPVGSIGSVANADATCASLASAAGIEGRAWVAYLGSTAACPGDSVAPCDPLTRLAGSRGWVNTRGEPIADGVAQLATDTDLWFPIRYEEDGRGGEADHDPITGVNVLLAAAQNCSDYTSSLNADRFCWARTGTTTVNALSQNCNGRCDQSRALLCFSTGIDTPLTPPVQTGRLAFVSSAPFIIADATSIADADQLCQADACAAGLTGSGDCAADLGTDRSFLAYLETSTTTAGSRFDPTGGDYVTPEGLPFLPASALTVAPTTQARPLTPLEQEVDGTLIGNARAWTGAAGGHCGDWSDPSANASVANHDNIFFWLSGSTRTCDGDINRVYCLEE